MKRGGRWASGVSIFSFKPESPALITEAAPTSMRRPGGTICIDGNEAANTCQCAHCGMHWIVVKGSGKKRGWCPTCGGVTCGKRGCLPCVSFQHKLDLQEKAARM